MPFTTGGRERLPIFLTIQVADGIRVGRIVMMNFYVGWMSILVGLVAGAAVGVFFHREDWLAGYGSWRRRMLRLMHILMVGTGLLNLAYALSLSHRNPDTLRFTVSLDMRRQSTAQRHALVAGPR